MAKPDVTNEQGEEESETTIFRAKRVLRERFTKLAERRNMPTISLINNALEIYLANNEYTLEDVIKMVDNDPSLKVSKSLIETELSGCPPFICAGVIDTMQNRDNYIFLEKFDNIFERIKSLDKKNLAQVFLHFSVVKFEPNKINELLRKITETFKEESFKIEVGIKQEDLTEDRALIFVAYNKKESKDGPV